MLDRITSNLSMGSGSFLEGLAEAGVRAGDLHEHEAEVGLRAAALQDAVPDVSVLEGMGLGAPLALP